MCWMRELRDPRLQPWEWILRVYLEFRTVAVLPCSNTCRVFPKQHCCKTGKLTAFWILLLLLHSILHFMDKMPIGEYFHLVLQCFSGIFLAFDSRIISQFYLLGFVLTHPCIRKHLRLIYLVIYLFGAWLELFWKLKGQIIIWKHSHLGDRWKMQRAS